MDRLDRRRLVAAVDAFRSATLGLFGLALPFELASLSRGGMAETLFDTASGSVLPAVVAKESLRKANGRLPAGQIFANNMAEPLLGGMLCASVAALPFPRAATFAAAALTLALRGRFRARPAAREENTPPSTIKTEIAEGSRGSGGTACRALSCPP